MVPTIDGVAQRDGRVFGEVGPGGPTLQQSGAARSPLPTLGEGLVMGAFGGRPLTRTRDPSTPRCGAPVGMTRGEEVSLTVDGAWPRCGCGDGRINRWTGRWARSPR